MGVYVLKADLVQVNIQRRRRAQASGEFAQRYAVRAGSEGTNSELKRAHGLGRAPSQTGGLPEGAGLQHQTDDQCPPGGGGQWDWGGAAEEAVEAA
jgi:hypothetical protein